ncbi:Fic family protein [Patescibacteria group bacterium]|nr:Fic family protein [Patescibacteria group bacterium]
MFKPKYTISSELLANIKRIGELIIDFNHRRFPEVILAELEKKARETSSHSSTSIEGNPLPLTEVRRILKNRPEHIRDTEREVLNYNQALVYLNNLINKKKIKFNLELILKIQKMVTLGLISDYRCGQLRTEPVFVNNPKLRQAVYLPPDHKDIEKLMKSLILFINQNKNKIDPLILAGIFHKQFVIIHPFIDGNGRTSRLATKVLLANMGLNTFNLFSFENYYNQNVTKYFEKVGLRGNYYDLKDKIDFSDWLTYFTDGIIDELLRVGDILKKESITPETFLKPYHKKILEFIEKNGIIADRDYAKLTDRAKPTRNLDFNKLIKLGLINRMGRGKATYYKLK